ncbi:MAG TPA: Clp protease N-terminal domain-containing protein [Candidatus Paceibacterota bacterium]
MFDRFDDNVKKTMALAREAAPRLNHEYIGTEHILLGLIHCENCTAVQVLRKMNIALAEIKIRVESLKRIGHSTVSIGQLPFSQRSKNVLELAMKEAENMGHNYLGTGHLLLGLIREEGCIAGQVLLGLGADLAATREKVTSLLAVIFSDPDAITILTQDFPLHELVGRIIVFSHLADLSAGELVSEEREDTVIAATILSCAKSAGKFFIRIASPDDMNYLTIKADDDEIELGGSVHRRVYRGTLIRIVKPRYKGD